MLAAVLGVGVGALMRASAGAAALLLLWPLVVEPLLGNLPNIGPKIGPYLPFAQRVHLHRRAMAVPLLRHAVGTRRVARVLRRRGRRRCSPPRGHRQPARCVTWEQWSQVARGLRCVRRRSASSTALGGCGGKPAKEAANPPSTPAAVRCGNRIRVRRCSGRITGRRDDGAPAEAAGDRRRQRRHPRAWHPGLRRERRLRRKALRDKGFDVQTPEFEVRLPFAEEPAADRRRRSAIDGQAAGVHHRHTRRRRVRPAGRRARRTTPRAARRRTTTGCRSKGAVVLVDRGTCPFAQKQAIAAGRGAVALIVANNEDGDEMGGTLGEDDRRQDPGRQRHQGPVTRLRANAGRQPPSSSTRASTSRTHPQRHRPDQDRLRPPTS